MTEAFPELWFIRHGETDWNLKRRIQGQTDIALNETGHAQARAIAQALSGLHDSLDGFDLQVSPLHRPRQTMQYIVDGFDLDWTSVTIDERLKELNFGELEGSTWPDLNARGLDPEKDPEGYHGFRPKGGESYADATVRVRDWLDSLAWPTIAVAHGGISRIVRGIVLDLPVAEIPSLRNPQWKFYRLKDGEIEWFRARPDQ
ncbi:MAG: histidine phosphatase family protein [Pseudomonadota bacterium]